MSEKNGPVGMALAGDRYGTEKYERSSERKKRMCPGAVQRRDLGVLRHVKAMKITKS